MAILEEVRLLGGTKDTGLLIQRAEAIMDSRIGTHLECPFHFVDRGF
jgi:hypothetical protein